MHDDTMPEIEDGQLILGRNVTEDGHDGGYVIARWNEEAQEPKLELQISDEDFERLHHFIHLYRDQAQAVESAAKEDGRAEAPEYTEEERVTNNLWDAGRISQELDRLYSVRSHLRAAIHRPRAGTPVVKGEFEAHPLYVACEARIAELQGQLEILI